MRREGRHITFNMIQLKPFIVLGSTITAKRLSFEELKEEKLRREYITAIIYIVMDAMIESITEVGVAPNIFVFTIEDIGTIGIDTKNGKVSTSIIDNLRKEDEEVVKKFIDEFIEIFTEEIRALAEALEKSIQKEINVIN